ncbi:hypothetical protein MTR67_024244 [Solanum verrucosum]|uniref:RNase H type-1 domain-containing protein n=1 Tax=Solanum verrucosum TaxID=315347 RepID=A0AAF0R3F7_SOLVR|nr:hypothetical protein MTR67_024244 [Solanum verrucosum]
MLLGLFKNVNRASSHFSEMRSSRIEGCWQEVQIKEVRWMRPPDTICKLNTAGSSLKNPDSIGGGGILRDSFGKMVYVFTIPLGVGTNNQAETLASIHGLQWCV